MAFPPPLWCGSDPRTCPKIFAVLEMLISMVGLIILVCLPILLLNFHDEVTYIQRFRSGNNTSNQEHAAAIPEGNLYYVLTTAFQLDGYYYCETYKQSVYDWLHAYLNFGKVDDKDKIKFQIADNYSTLETYDDDKHRTHCVLDLYTPENPARDIVKSKGKIYTMKSIVAHCLLNRTEIKIPLNQLYKQMHIIPPQVSESYVKITYPGSYSDPAKFTCITKHMALGNAKETEESFYSMFSLMVCSAIGSIILSFFVLGTGGSNKISSKFLLLTFGLQWIPIILLLSAVFHAISPTLCLMEYGGISPNGQSSPLYLQTTIGYTCGIYIVFFKGYLLWLLVSYSANLSEIKMIIKKKERAKKQVAIAEEKVNENENATEESEDIEANSKKEGKSEGVDKSASVNNNKPPPKIRHPSATSDSSLISDDDEDGDDEVEDESGLYDLLAFASSKQKRNRRSRVSMSTASPKPIQTNTKGTLGLGRFGKSFW